MEVKIKNKILEIKHKLKKNETYRIAKNKKFNSVQIFRTPQIVSGFSNKTESNHGILTIDYDGVDLSVVLEDFKAIQKSFSLPQAYLFTTKKNNYHVVCIKKFIHSKIYQILLHTRADTNYISMPVRNPYRSYVLRLSSKVGSKKPRFVEMIGKNINNSHEVSQAHLNLLIKLYPKIEHPNYKKLDGGKKVLLQKYETSQ